MFEGNTDITLALRINNTSGKDFLWEYYYDCQLIQWSDFLLVYKKIGNTCKGADDQTEPVGRPYLFPSYCLAMNLPPETIPPGISVIMGAQWSNIPDDDPLGPGKYFTAVNRILDMNGHQKKFDLRVDFEMK